MATIIVGGKMKSCDGYGKAAYLGPASDEPGDKTSADFEASQDNAEGVRAKIASEGFSDRGAAESGSVADLQRKIDIKPQPDAHGMQSARARQAGDTSTIGKVSTLPGSLTDDEAQPVRTP